jgi:hypothetical protein
MESLPKDLEQAYTEIVSTLQSTHAADSIAQTRLMLTWATFAKRPLTVQEFRDAMAVQPNLSNTYTLSRTQFRENRIEVRGTNWAALRHRVVDMCGCLLEIVRSASTQVKSARRSTKRLVRPTDTIQLLQQTVKDFLVANASAAPLNLNPAEGEMLIGSAAYKYLILSFPMNELHGKEIGRWKRRHYQAFIEHLEDRPLLSYVLSFLPHHLHLANDVRSGLTDFIHQSNPIPTHGLYLSNGTTAHVWEHHFRQNSILRMPYLDHLLDHSCEHGPRKCNEDAHFSQNYGRRPRLVW